MRMCCEDLPFPAPRVAVGAQLRHGCGAAEPRPRLSVCRELRVSGLSCVLSIPRCVCERGAEPSCARRDDGAHREMMRSVC